MTGGWIVSNFSGSTAATIGSKLVVNYTTPFLLSMLDEKIVDTCVDCKFMQFQAISGEIWLALGFKWYHIFRQKQCTTVFGTATPVISRIIYKVLTYFNLLRSCINWPALSFLRFHFLGGIRRIREVIRQSSQNYFTTSSTTFQHADIWVCLKLGYARKTTAFFTAKTHIDYVFFVRVVTF